MVNRKHHYGQGSMWRFLDYDEWSHCGDWFDDWLVVRDFLHNQFIQEYIRTIHEDGVLDEYYDECCPIDIIDGTPGPPIDENEPF